MHITVWNDYICPWAYAARPLTAWLREAATAHGATVEQRSFELHPEIAAGGVPVRPGGRLDRVFDHIADECAASGLEFSKPSRSPNTHRILQLTEIVNAAWPQHFALVDERLARAHWVDGLAIDDPSVVRRLLTDAGLDPDAVFEHEASGEGARLLEASMTAAREAGATGTPAWLVNGMVITGLHPQSQFERWLTKMLERAG